MTPPDESPTPGMNRRHFLGSTLKATAVGSLLGTLSSRAAEAPPASGGAIPAPNITRKVKIGIVGGGPRGHLVGGFFKEHGGYEIHAVADYFPDLSEKLGNTFGVDGTRRYSGLSGCRKMIGSGVEAVVLLDVPYFFPEQARTAVESGCHVYLAKPVAVDVPGTLLIGELGKQATGKNLCFLVDYQLPYDPAVGEVISRIHQGALGPLAHILSFGKFGKAWDDPPMGPTIASRLRDEIWLSDVALGGDTLLSYDIHIIDALMAVLGKQPVRATGSSRICRPDPHGDRMDACGLVFEMDDGLMWTHTTQSLTNHADLGDLRASIFGLSASAQIGYFAGKVFVHGGPRQYVGQVSRTIYTDGPRRNVAEFYSSITGGGFENKSVQRAVDGTLTAILGREASARRTTLTMAELIAENKRLEVDLSGLTA